MKPTTVQVNIEEWQLIEQVIETAFDRLQLMTRVDATHNEIMTAIKKNIEAITKLAEYKGVPL